MFYRAESSRRPYCLHASVSAVVRARGLTPLMRTTCGFVFECKFEVFSPASRALRFDERWRVTSSESNPELQACRQPSCLRPGTHPYAATLTCAATLTSAPPVCCY
eukprot:scaffold35107_cov70-Phaeocystis_antarctica.AAC.2